MNSRFQVFSLSLAATVLLLSSACQRPPLRAVGELTVAIQKDSPQLAKVAATLPELSLKQAISENYWLQRFREDRLAASLADFYRVEWGVELIELANSGQLYDAKALWRRSLLYPRAPDWLKHLELGPEKGFIPTAVYTWGLFVNANWAIDYLPETAANLAALEAIFAEVKLNGITPIALGAAYGWPAAAWFTVLDLYLNGPKVAAERYNAQRPFDDDSAKTVFRKLAEWRELGYFSAKAATNQLIDSIHDITSGQAFCGLLGAFSYESFSAPFQVRFIPLPLAEGKVPPAGLVGMTGYALPAGLEPAKAEAVYAFLEAVILAGSPDQAASPYKFPLLAVMKPERSNTTVSVNQFKQRQIDQLASFDEVILSFDQALPAQVVRATIPLWAGFFSPNGADADSFAVKLQAAIAAALLKAR